MRSVVVVVVVVRVAAASGICGVVVLQVVRPAEGVAVVSAAVLSVGEGVRARGVSVVRVLDLELLGLVARLLLKVVVLTSHSGKDVLQFLVFVVAWRIVVADGKGAPFWALADGLTAPDVR